MVNDPIVEEVRKIRKEIESACDNDPVKYAEHLRQLELKHADRLVWFGPKAALHVLSVAEDKATYGSWKNHSVSVN